jgi:hypothetical protein
MYRLRTPRRCSRFTSVSILRRAGFFLALAISCRMLVPSLYAQPIPKVIEQDWLMYAEHLLRGNQGAPTPQGDARGAVDGVRDGKYAFHTGAELSPWWQVDLGQEHRIARVVVYNRLDYAPGLHNADNLDILTSDNGIDWKLRHQNRAHFGGITGAAPLDVKFTPPVAARFVRLRVSSDKPVFLHLDEVEVYGSVAPAQNLAVGCNANQSSLSPWSVNKPSPEQRSSWDRIISRTIQQGQALAEELHHQGVDTSGFSRALHQMAVELTRLADHGQGDELRALYLRTRCVVRQLVFSNPLLNFDELLIVKRFTQETYPDVCLNHMPWVSRPGGDILVLRLNGPDAIPDEHALLKGALGPGHVHGIDLNWCGDSVVFGYAKAKGNEPPVGWLDRTTNFDLRRNVEPIHLFEIGIDSKNLRQLTDGQWSDLDPAYLPNDSIAFVSERCGCSLQCNEWDKDETSCNLYVMDGDGNNIRRLSASKDGDYLPHVLDDGTIAYCRWEYQERGWAHIQSIWTVRPDGTGADALFKQHLNDPWALEDIRSIPVGGTRRLVGIAAGHHTLAAGPVVVVTPSVGMNDAASIRIVTADVLPPEGGMSGTPVAEGGVRDGSGYYMTPWALSDKYFLVSYTYGAKQNAPRGYGIYLVDVFGNKELIYRDSSISCFSPIPLRSRPRPPVVTDITSTEQSKATLAVANVAHGVDGVSTEQVRFLRISERLVWPYDNERGGQRYHEVPHTQELVPNWTPVRILGEVPVEPDGSAHFQIPADTPVYFQLLDKDRMEIRRMRSFISLQPGETRMCVGCHETRGEAPVAKLFPLALLHDPQLPTPPPWGAKPISFLRDVQPIFDRHCVGCHHGLSPAGGLDFSPGLRPRHVIPAFSANRAYETIRSQKLVARSNIHDDARVTQPYMFGSHLSKLVQVLKHGACSQRARLSADEWYRLVTWIDANAPYHDKFLDKRSTVPTYDFTTDQGLLHAIRSVHEQRCQQCHDPNDVTQPHWIDVKHPEKSLFLVAPLARDSGGNQTCGVAVYGSVTDADYQRVLTLTEQAVRRAWQFPRRDLEGL